MIEEIQQTLQMARDFNREMREFMETMGDSLKIMTTGFLAQRVSSMEDLIENSVGVSNKNDRSLIDMRTWAKQQTGELKALQDKVNRLENILTANGTIAKATDEQKKLYKQEREAFRNDQAEDGSGKTTEETTTNDGHATG